MTDLKKLFEIARNTTSIAAREAALDAIEKHIDNIEKENMRLAKRMLGNKDINELIKEIHENAVDHGWWDDERSFGEIIALCHSELSEALEEYRKGFGPRFTYYNDPGKPEGIPTELADCMIRILDYCGHVGVDMEEIIREKHEFNKSRPYKHGGKKI